MPAPTDLRTEMADITRLEYEARRMRAAVMADLLRRGWHALFAAVSHRRTAG